jgi:hypothetical protein
MVAFGAAWPNPPGRICGRQPAYPMPSIATTGVKALYSSDILVDIGMVVRRP